MASREQLREFLFRENNWFRDKYEAKLSAHSSRYWTFKAALDLFLQRGHDTIVETGATREPDDYGAGYSSVIFADFLSRYDGELITIDNDERHLGICQKLVKETFPQVRHRAVSGDSVVKLKEVAAPGRSVGMVYLDSWDFPAVEIARLYGDVGDWDAIEAKMNAMSQVGLIETHKELIAPCQEHCLAEVQAAAQMTDIILIDDCLFAGGKPRLAKDWLLESGQWVCILEDRQTLWIRK